MHRLKNNYEMIKASKCISFMLLMSVMLIVTTTCCHGADTSSKDSEESSSTDTELQVDGMLSEYDFSDIDKTAGQYGYSGSFEDILKQIIGEGMGAAGTGSGWTGKMMNILDKTILISLRGNKLAVVQIILLSVLSAAVRCFGATSKNSQVSDVTQMIISISLMGILLAAFVSASAICADAINMCINMYKSIIPVFFSLVMLVSGSTTAAVYYEVVLILITAVNMLFGNVLLVVDKIYLLFAMADNAAGEELFSKAVEFIPSIIKWSCKGTLIFFTGLGGIKSMIAPLSDSVKKNIFYKAMEIVPGIGNSVEAVSQTVLGAGSIIKNGIGTAAVIILLVVNMIPVLKLAVLACLFKVTAVVLEPVTDKRIIRLVNSASIAIGLLTQMLLTVLSLFVLMVAIICMTTGR